MNDYAEVDITVDGKRTPHASIQPGDSIDVEHGKSLIVWLDGDLARAWRLTREVHLNEVRRAMDAVRGSLIEPKPDVSRETPDPPESATYPLRMHADELLERISTRVDMFPRPAPTATRPPRPVVAQLIEDYEAIRASGRTHHEAIGLLRALHSWQ